MTDATRTPDEPSSEHRWFEIRRVPKRGRLVMIGVLFVLLTTIGLLLSAFILMTEPGEVGLLTLPAAMAAIGAAMGFVFVHNLLGRRAVEEIVLDLETPVLHLDDAFEFYARFLPQTDVELNGVHATFQCVEKAFYRAGTRSRTYTKVVWEDELPLADRVRCRRDQESRFGGQFKTPAEGMCSFVGANHSVTWRLMIHVDIARWPDVREEFAITVLPVLGERPPGL